MTIKHDAPHTVYIHWDAAGEPLYAGCTVDLAARTAQHRSSPWHSQIASVSVDSTHPTFITGRARERELIADLEPRYNRDGHPAVQREQAAWTQLVLLVGAYEAQRLMGRKRTALDALLDERLPRLVAERAALDRRSSGRGLKTAARDNARRNMRAAFALYDAGDKVGVTTLTEADGCEFTYGFPPYGSGRERREVRSHDVAVSHEPGSHVLAAALGWPS